MAKKIKIGKKHFAVFITVIVFLVIGGLHLLGVFHYLEYKSYDVRVRFWADTTYSRPSDEITVILLDQDSIDWAQKEKGWGWPWPRQAYAEVVDYMNLSKAHSIAFDVIFSEPSVYRNSKQDEIINNAIKNLEQAETDAAAPKGQINRAALRTTAEALRSLNAKEDDNAYIRASEDFGRVVQTVMFSNQTGSITTWPDDVKAPLFRPEGFGPMLERFSIGEDAKAQFPIKGLRDAAGALGSVTGVPDSDGIIRRIRPFTLFDGKAIPGLSTASLVVSGRGQELTYNEKTGVIEWEGASIPVDKNGFALLRYHGHLDEYIPYRAMDIIRSAEALKNGDDEYMESEYYLPPENFEDTYVFFGFYAQGLFDIFNTPISSVYPGMGCHITMMDNILQDNFIRESEEWLNLLILFVVVVLVVCLTIFSPRISLSVTGMAIIVVAIIIVSFAAFQFTGLWLPMVTYLGGTLASFITVMLYNYATEGSQKRFIKSAFSQYLSPKVIEQIIHDPSQLKLGGEKREMTAIFTDVRSFSTISEALGDPAKLVELLNFYLTRMSDIVLNNQGTIDKYEGDAIIAFFGAPIHMQNHAALACRAAINMKKAEVEINKEALEKGFINQDVLKALAGKGIIGSIDDPSPIFTRLGVNTGDMVVGNMGTPNKMDYTIMGNAVNLAARLEGVNKQYDTGGILISEYTKAHLGDEFTLRPLSRVRVVGVNTPLRLYELLGIASEASPELQEMVKNWEKAFEFYEKREFQAAQAFFRLIFDNNKKDFTAKKYLDRCEKFVSTPPNEKNWDNGVDNLTEK
jgi:adenylate cyclase